MDAQKIMDWLLTWVSERSGQANANVDTAANFMEEGWVDSIGVIQLISAAEEEFGIRFNEEHFANPDFATIAGLANIIAEAQQRAASRPGPRR